MGKIQLAKFPCFKICGDSVFRIQFAPICPPSYDERPDYSYACYVKIIYIVLALLTTMARVHMFYRMWTSLRTLAQILPGIESMWCEKYRQWLLPWTYLRWRGWWRYELRIDDQSTYILWMICIFQQLLDSIRVIQGKCLCTYERSLLTHL